MNAPRTPTNATTEAPTTQAAGAAPHTPGSGDRYVVGVDGSEQSIEALRWAARFAAGTGASIDAVTTWEPRVGMAGPFVATANGTYVVPEDDNAKALLSRAVESAYGLDRPANLSLRAQRGAAAHVLTEESRTAQLLVIGSRGMSEVPALLLGSVSAHCAEKAHCPVLIMHAPDPS